MHQTSVANACKAHDIKNGRVAKMHIFFLPNRSIKGPILKDPIGSAMATILAETKV